MIILAAKESEKDRATEKMRINNQRIENKKKEILMSIDSINSDIFHSFFKLIKNSSKRITAMHFAMYANGIRFLCFKFFLRCCCFIIVSIQFLFQFNENQCLGRECFLLKKKNNITTIVISIKTMCWHMPRHSFVC